MARKQRKRKTPKDPIKRRRIAVFGGFSRWPGYLEPAGPAAEIERRGGTPVADPKAVADCDVVVFGDKRGKGKTEAGRQAEKAVAAGAKLEVVDEAAFLAWLAPDVTGKRFAFAGGFDFCHDGLAEAQPPALVEALGAVVSEEVDADVDVLVVGDRRGAGKAARVRAAEALIAEGSGLRMMNERGFLELIRREPVAGGPSDVAGFLIQLQALCDPRRITRALKMLKSESFELYHDVADDHVVGVVGSQTSRDKVYSNVLYADGRYSCCDQDLYECMGLQGSICKHLLVLLIGLTRTGELGLEQASAWVKAGSNKHPASYDEHEDALAATFLRYKAAQAGEVDWRPLETVPEDFMAF